MGQLRILVTASRAYLGVGVDLGVCGVDERGVKYESGGANLGPNFVKTYAKLPPDPKMDGEPPYALTAPAQEMLALIKRLDRTALSLINPTKEQIELGAKPDEHDPLATFPGELFSSYAKDRGKNLVANMPDPLFGFALTSALVDGPIRLGKFLKKTAERNPLVRILDEDGWMEIAPTDPTLARNEDRNVQRQFLDRFRGEGFASIENVCAFQAAADVTEPESLGDLLAVLMGAWGESFNAGVFPKLYGLLSDDQKSAMFGAGLGLDDLTSAQKQVLWLALNRPSVRPPRELTELYPNGLPGSIRLTAKASEGVRYNVYRDSYMSRASDESNFARELAMQDKASSETVVRFFEIFSVRSIDIKVADGNDLLVSDHLSEARVAPVRYRSLAELPDSMRSRIQALVAQKTLEIKEEESESGASSKPPL